MAKPKPDELWHVFAIDELPLKFGHDYPVDRTVNSGTGATTAASEIACTTGAIVVGILGPKGDIGRVGHGNYLAMLPPFLRGVLVRHTFADSVRILEPT